MRIEPLFRISYAFLFCALISQSYQYVGAKEIDKAGTSIKSSASKYPLDFQQLIDNTISEIIPGIVLLVETKNYKFLGSSGMANTEHKIKMPTTALMYNASAGKTAIALLSAMLHEEGVLDINVPISRYLPKNLLSQIPNSELMTLNHLLSHTSGVYNYLDDEAVYFDVINNPKQLKTDEYMLKFALNKTAYFQPGKQFSYSDTGYLLTGLVLDKVLGYHHSKALRQRILIPLGLNKTFYKGIEKKRNEMVSGYFANNMGRPIFDVNQIVNTKVLQENIGTADGPLVSTVEELAHLLKATIIGSNIITSSIRDMLFGEASLNDMQYTWYGNWNSYYGKGMITEHFKNTPIYHHPGIGLGYNTNNIYIPKYGISITSFANCGVSNGCDDNLHRMVTKILSAVVESHLN